MHVVRGRESIPEADIAVNERLQKRVQRSGEPALRVWYPPRHVAFGRRDRAAEGYARARQAAADHGFPPTERETGGRAVAFTGDVLAVLRAEPADPAEPAIDERYERLLVDLESGLQSLGVDPARGEPPDSFCPGTRSLQADGKLVGLAQRVRSEVAVVAGAVVVRDPEAVAAVLRPVYEALGLPFDPSSVGSLADVGGEADPQAVRRTIEDALVGDAETSVRRVRDT